MIFAYSHLFLSGHDRSTARYVRMKVSPKEHLSNVSQPGSKERARKGDFRLYFNGKPTEFFESAPDIPLHVFMIGQRGTRDVFLVSTRTSNGAILAWIQSYFYWDGKLLRLVRAMNGDSLEFHPDGRLLAIQQYDSFVSVLLPTHGTNANRDK